MAVSRTRCYILSIWFALQLIPMLFAADKTMRQCFTDPPPDTGQANVTIECPPDHTILVENALFGRNRWLICDLAEDDCTDRTQFFHSCDGLNNCTKTFKIFSPKCNGYSTILLLSYSCEREYSRTIVPTQIYGEDSNSSPPQTQTDGDHTSQDRGTTSWPRYPSHDRKELEEENEEEDVGVIIGYAVAAIITIIMLLIAIILVIRALLQYHKRGQAEEPPGRLVSCMYRMCIQVDRMPCFSSEEPDNQSLRSRKYLTSHPHTSGMGPAKLPSDRIAPVGQECSIRGSNSSIDSGLFEMQKNSNHSEQQTTGADVEQTSRELRHSRVVAGNVDSNNDIIRNPPKSFKNSSHQTKNCPDKVSSWRQKELTTAMLAEQRDSNQNLSGKPPASNVELSKPKFDAVAIPNTETVTMC